MEVPEYLDLDEIDFSDDAVVSNTRATLAKPCPGFCGLVLRAWPIWILGRPIPILGRVKFPQPMNWLKDLINQMTYLSVPPPQQ